MSTKIIYAINLRNSVDHVQSHFHAAFSVVVTRLWQSRNAVVAVAKKFDAQAVMFWGQSVESVYQK